MCEFHECNCNGFGDIWWTDKCIYFSSIDRSGTIVRYIIITNSTVTVTVSDSTNLFIVFKTTNKYFSIQVVTV